MSAPFLSVTDGLTDSVAYTAPHGDPKPARYRLAVLADSAADVARHAGGLLCDLALNGWNVTVLTGANQDVRGLHILGAQIRDLENALTAGRGPWPVAVAVAGNLYRHDSRVQRIVLEALKHDATDLMLWQTPSESELGHLVAATVHHQPSTAAQAFKMHALAALGAPTTDPGCAETFRSSAPTARRGLVATT